MDPVPTTPLSSSITNHLSAEIYGAIISIIAWHSPSSKTILCRFCFVSKSFLHFCRQHLFLSLTLRPKLVEEFLVSPHAIRTVLPHVRSIALGGVTDGKYLALIQHLERVQELHLETWSLDSVWAKALSQSLATHSQTMTTLSLRYINFPSFSILLDFISAIFTTLQHLSLDNVTWDHIDVHGEPTVSPRGLETLSIVSCLNSPILSWFSGIFEAGGHLPVYSLHLPEFLPTERLAIARFLRGIGSTLRYLDLGMLPHESGLIHESDDLDLSFCTNLCSLEIRELTLYQFMPADNSPSIIDMLPSLLLSVNSSLIQLTFHMWLSQEWHLDRINWRRVAEALSKPNYANLRHLQIQIRGMGKDRGDIRRWLNERLNSDAISSILDVRFDVE
ncbi:hypothetical protein C8J56DRAFT_916175 [Mycena floridula]|nr:hypothetical protein C8J56DRAFT_916175 [Mycena floridula]